MTCPPKYAIGRKQLHLIRFRKDFAYQFLKIFFRFFPKGKARHAEHFYLTMENSIRRLSCRPSAVALSAMGLSAP